ncbi:MAG: hypothetical protein ACRENP_21605, partial [Longimicrobiales bacterium]
VVDGAPRVPWGPAWRVTAISAGALFVLFAANVFATSLSGGPEALARRHMESRVAPGARIELLRSHYFWLWGIGRSAAVDFVVTRATGTDTLQVQALKWSGFTPWRIEGASFGMMRRRP